MPSQDIQFQFDLDDDDLAILKGSLPNNIDIDLSINKVAKAAFEEYLKLFIGQKVFTRGSDINEFRLFLLIKYVFDGKVPSEDTVSRLFQLTHSQSKSLIKSIMSKYQYEMSDMIRNSLIETLDNAQPYYTNDDTLDGYKVDIKTSNILEELNKILGHLDGGAPLITKESRTYSTYVIKPTSYERLKDYFTND